MVEQSLIDTVKQRITLSSVVSKIVELKKQGQGLLGLCPFHKENTPSFYVRDNEGRFKCFGCGASGDVIEFLMKFKGISFKDAVDELLEIIGLAQKKPEQNQGDSLLKVQKLAQEYFLNELINKSQGKEARKYLVNERGLLVELIKKIGIGFGGLDKKSFFDFLRSKNIDEKLGLKAGVLKEGRFGLTPTFFKRITFPIRNYTGDIIAFGARNFLDNETSTAKYINTHNYQYYEKGKNIYGIYESKKFFYSQKMIFLVEGYFDALAFWSLGFPCVSLLGTSLTKYHISLIKKLSSTVGVVFDRDRAGLLGLKNSLPLFFEEGIEAFAVSLNKKDPGVYLEEKKILDLKEEVQKPKDAFCYLIEQTYLNSTNDVHQKTLALESLFPIFSSIKNLILKKQYVSFMAKIFNEDISLLWHEILKNKNINKNHKIEDKKNIDKDQFSELEKIAIKTIILNKDNLSKIMVNLDLFSDYFQSVIKNIEKQGLSENLVEKVKDGLQVDEQIADEFIKSLEKKKKNLEKVKNLRKNREILLKSEKNNDFEQIKKVLKEQSLLLKIEKKYEEKPLVMIKEKDNKSISLEKENVASLIFDEESTWF